ncbi:hypothetical protein CR513_41481, partial [Mucuna pruriens]
MLHFLESESYYSLATTSNSYGVTWNEDLKWWDCITKSEDSSNGIIGHGKATRETTDTRTTLQAETDPTTLQVETGPIQFDEAKHDKAMIATLLSNVPNDDSLEVVHDVRSLELSLDENSYINIRNKLPFRHNREIGCITQGKKIEGCKWVFSLKHKAYGSIESCKVKYTENLIISSCNSRLATYEEVYIDISPGYVVPSKDKLVCKLKRALKETAFIVYIDDMIIIGNDTKEIAKIQMQLSTKFEG